MFDEYSNKKGQEFNSQVENKVAHENVFAAENKTVKENINVKENIEFDGKSHRKIEKTKARNKAISVLTTSLVGVVGIVVAGMTNLVNIKLKAKFIKDDFEYRDGKVAFTIEVQNLTEKEYIIVYPEQDSKKLDSVKYTVDDVKDGLIHGTIDAQPDYIQKQLAGEEDAAVTYKLNLRGMVGLDVERLFDSGGVRIENIVESKFETIEGYCNCAVDGYYHFTLTFDDDLGNFSNFKAYIYDSIYEELESQITENSSKDKIDSIRAEQEKHISRLADDPNRNWHEKQKIFVLDLQGSKGTLVIEFDKKVENGVEPEHEKIATPIEL